MNTAQLAVLWYVGLIIATLLAFVAVDRDSIGHLIGALVILGGLFLYTLKPHPAASKRRLLLAVAGPILVIVVAGAGLRSYNLH